jgi:opacity protein-like surface antigen
MEYHKLLLGFLLVGALAPLGRAQDQQPKLDLSLSYSYIHVKSSSTSELGTQGLNGGNLSISYKFRNWARLVGDVGLGVSGYRDSDILGIKLRATQTTYMIGPRLVLPLGRLDAFAQGLFGVAHANAGMFDTPGKQTDFAYTVGGGFDYGLTKHFAVRPIQFEFLRTNFFELQYSKLTQNDLRASTGIVFRF